MDSIEQKFFWISTFAFGLAAVLGVGTLVVQTIYPEKPSRLVVSRPPDSSVDTVARPLAQILTEAPGTSAVVGNVVGAADNIATERIAKTAPDN